MGLMKKYRKIDAHSHFGKSFLGPESNIDVYLTHAQEIGVVTALASPGPTPEIHSTNGIYYPCLWEVTNGVITYFQQWGDVDGTLLKKNIADKNPYHGVNEELFKKVSKLIYGPKIYVMPIHHPKLDTLLEIKLMLEQRPSVALKVHGISTFTGPEDISPTVIDILRKTNKPIVVHTDLYFGEAAQDIHRAYKLNDPNKWVEWAKETKIKLLITHGARLSETAINLAKKLDNVRIGIAPDLLLMSEPERLALPTEEYLEFLLKTVPSDKLIYDIDYGWNVSERNNWSTLDWGMHLRIMETANKLDISDENLQFIFYENSAIFFDIK